MRNKLPLAEPPNRTYQGNAFILGILMACENTKNVYYNKYINLKCNRTKNIYAIGLDFAEVTWEDYRLSGIAEMDLYAVVNISPENFEGFIKERIDQGNYLLFYCVDEFYLSYTKNFQFKHYKHDTYVYGYEEDDVYVMAYSNDRLSRIKIPISELANSLYCYEKVDFCTFRPNISINIEIDLFVIYKSLYQYIYPVYIEEDMVYGIDVYNVLEDNIQDIVSRVNEEGEGVDLRPFRLLWEHKKMWKERIAKLNGLFVTAYEIKNEIEIIENKARIIFMLALKYQITWENSILQRIMDYLKEMEVKDKVWSHAVLEVIRKSLI